MKALLGKLVKRAPTINLRKLYLTLHLVDNFMCCFKKKSVNGNGFEQMISLLCQHRHLLLFPTLLTDYDGITKVMMVLSTPVVVVM